MIFYTIIYKIQSKFDFNKYAEWGKNLIKYLQNHKIIIFTNDETYDLIKNLLNKNIFIIKLDINDFYYHRYRYLLRKNTCNKCFPDHNVSYELILLWIERHLLIEKIKDDYKSDFYCYIDWGYIREKNYFIKNINFNIDENFIYWGLVNPKKESFDFYKSIFDENNSNLSKNINEIIINQKIEKYQPIFGGGFSIIPHKMIDTFINIYKNSLNYILENQILFKDDQTILAFMIINNLDKFKLISKDNHKIEWFPFIYFFKGEFKVI